MSASARRRLTFRTLLRHLLPRERVSFSRRERRIRLLLEQLEDRSLMSASIFGSVWNDLIGDGIRQAGEPGLPSVVAYLDLNQNGQRDGSVTTSPGNSTIAPAPGELGGFGFVGSTLQVQGLPDQLLDVNVSLDIVNNGTSDVVVNVVSPTGLIVPNLPILFNIRPGEHFIGSFDEQSTRPITLETSTQRAGEYRPIGFFSDPRAHMYDGSPNGTWGLLFIGDDTSGMTINSWSLTLTSPEPSATTDASGNYAFTGLAAGSYDVAPLLAPGDTLTTAPRSVTVGANQSVSGIDLSVKPAPDLVATHFELAGPATAWGQDVTVNYTLTNRGAGSAPAFDLELRLSSNGIIDANSPLLGTISVGALAGLATVTGTATVRLPSSPPAGFNRLDGAFLGLRLDPGNAIVENDETNNSNEGDGIDLAPLALPANVALAAEPGRQQMPSVAVNPRDSDHIVTAYMDSALGAPGFTGIAIRVSRDGGATWTRTPIAIPANYAQGAANPTVRFDGEGRVYVSFMAATFLGVQPALTNPSAPQRQRGFNANNGVFVARSDDGGTTFGTPSAVVSHLFTGAPVFFEMMPDSAIDTFKNLPDGTPNPNYGNVYVTWLRLYPAGQFPGVPTSTGGSDVMMAVSRDGGATWTAHGRTSPAGQFISAIKDPDHGTNGRSLPGRGLVFFPHTSVGADGSVYVSMFGGGDFTVYHSANAGAVDANGIGVATFRAPDRASGLGVPFTAALPFATLFNDTFRTVSARAIVADPLRPGHVYVAESNQVFNPVLGGLIDAGEVIFARSDDYGQTWQRVFTVGTNPLNVLQLDPAQRDNYLSAINDDNQGRYLGFETNLEEEVITGQALPNIAIDAQGNLVVTWYDTRRDPADHNLDVFAAVSRDGGQSFSANFRVTDTAFDSSAGVFTDGRGAQNNTYLGDRFGIAAANGSAYIVWTDTRNPGQGQDVYFARQLISPVPGPLNDRFEPNNTPPDSTDLGAVTVQRLIPKLVVAPGDNDWYRLETVATGNLVVSATTPQVGAGLSVRLTDLAGTVLDGATITDLTDASGAIIGQQVVYPTTSGQTYLVHVTSSAPVAVPYSLVLASLTGDLGTRVSGSTAGTIAADEQAVYRLAAGVTGRLDITLTSGLNVQGNLNVQVLSADGRTVLANGTSSGIAGPAEVESLSIAVEAGQVVLLKISGDPGSLGDFELDFTNRDQFQIPSNPSLFFPVGGDPASSAVGDLNGDGKPDLFVTSTDFSDPASVLLGNGDGSFQAARRFDVGPGLSGTLTAGFREPALGDVNGDGKLDAVVPNFRAADVSVLIGRGDGTFEPQRRFDAVRSPDSLTLQDVNGDGKLDILTLENFPQLGGFSLLGILIGRGDGTFVPPIKIQTALSQGAFPIRTGDFNGDGKTDLVLFSKNEPRGQLFLGMGDGSFTDRGLFAVGENTFDVQVADLDGDRKLDLVTAGTNNGNVYLQRGNGDGTFQAPVAFNALLPRPGDNVGVNGLVIVDFDGDGRRDLVVTAHSRSGAGLAQVLLLPGLVDANNQFAGFGAAVRLAQAKKAGKISLGDFDGDQAIDLAVTDRGGVRVIGGRAFTLPTNNTPASARGLGTVYHVTTLPQSIVPGNAHAYYTLTVPTEAVIGAGDQVIDFSALFQFVEGAGVQLEVLDAAGNVLGSGPRFRIQAAQGQVLTLHVFGVPDANGIIGAGAYTLDINVLPQLVSAEAQSALPGGPATSMVLSLQGDRLDPATTENPLNYVVTWLGADGRLGTSDDVVVTPTATAGSKAIVYNPDANTEVSSGQTFRSSVRQTVTLFFDRALFVGSYSIALSSGIRTADLSTDEAGLLALDAIFGGHPIVSFAGGVITAGTTLLAGGLVSAPTPGNLDLLGNGTAALTQYQNNLMAQLDLLLRTLGDGPAVTQALNDQTRSLFEPSYVGDARNTSFLILWLDPVSIDLADPAGNRATFNLQSNALTSSLPKTFIEVGGNVEVMVIAASSGTFRLNVADVQATARGGALMLHGDTIQSVSLTSAMQAGERTFEFRFAGADGAPVIGTGPIAPPISGSPSLPPIGSLPTSPDVASAGGGLSAFVNFATSGVVVSLASGANQVASTSIAGELFSAVLVSSVTGFTSAGIGEGEAELPAEEAPQSVLPGAAIASSLLGVRVSALASVVRELVLAGKRAFPRIPFDAIAEELLDWLPLGLLQRLSRPFLELGAAGPMPGTTSGGSEGSTRGQVNANPEVNFEPRISHDDAIIDAVFASEPVQTGGGLAAAALLAVGVSSAMGRSSEERKRAALLPRRRPLS